MSEVIKFRFPEGADREEVEGDACLALFSAECLHGRPQTRMEVSYLVDADATACVFHVRGPAGETAARVFVGLCGERFGEAGFRVERVDPASRVRTVPEQLYPACSIRRARRTGAEMEAIREAILAVLRTGFPMTLRQLFYKLVSLRVIAKTEAEYDNTVGRLVKEMRLGGQLPWHWITDNTRGQRKVRTNSSLEEALEETARFYRRDIWDDQPEYVEIWCEKDAISGVLWPVVAQWHVPLMITRGYPSLSFMYETAATISAVDRRVHIAYLGDWDPSGLDIQRNVEERLREFAPDVELDFRRLAITPDQVREFGLLTRPTKATDSRAKRFRGESVEVDAIDSNQLREMVEEFIAGFVDQRRLAQLRIAEESEREVLRVMPGIARGLR
jgi:hypothetical protein